MAHLLTIYLFLSCLHTLTEANSTHLPRMILTHKENAFIRLPSPAHPARLLLSDRPDVVAAVGQTHLSFYDFQNPEKTPAERQVLWGDCSGSDCNYKLTVVQQRDENSLFACGTNGRKALCCNMNISEPSPTCVTSEKMNKITESIEGFINRESEHSALVESEQHGADLYMAYSGSQGSVGIYRFGGRRVMPASHDKEQHYAGLVLSRRGGSPSQDRVYAFYKQKNRDTGLDSEMWTSYVSQVCMADVGGPKNHLQFQWTSQMSARLFCGDPESRQHYSELVHTAAVHADDWRDTKIYALFRNEWGMSAVCIYTARDVDQVFTDSPFKGSTPEMKLDRPRMCVDDSTRIPADTLRMVDKTSEMEAWVRPADRAGPLLFNRHNYTHISVDGSGDIAVLFLTLNNGRIHKVMQSGNQTFVIAEYRPFDHTAHILSVILHSSSKKLYVNTKHQLVRLDVANCSQYGSTCEDCVLSRDPYCGWNQVHCTRDPQNSLQDASGDLSACPSSSQLHHPGKGLKHTNDEVVSVTLPSESRYFLRCPVSSRHAQYSWRSRRSTTACSWREEQCLLLIDSMSPQQEGTYRCLSEEEGYHKVLAHYRLQLESRAPGRLPGPLLWVCLVLAVIIGLIY